MASESTSEPSASGEKPLHKELNPFGDIRLSVKSKTSTCEFRVVSYQLMAASSFFANLLSPASNFAEAVAFRENRTQGPFPLSINLEDLPTERAEECCEMILRNIHGLPPVIGEDGKEGEIRMEDLYDFAVVADYLGCVAAGRLLTKSEMAKLRSGDGEYVGDMKDLDKWLYVATLLKNEDVFKTITRHCIKYGKLFEDTGFEFEVLKEGKYGFKVTESFQLKLAPPRIIGRLRSEVANKWGKVSQKFDENYALYNAYHKTGEYPSCRNSEFEWGCWITQAGLLTHFKKFLGIRVNPDGRENGLNSLCRLNAIMLYYQARGAPLFNEGHIGCDPFIELLQFMNEILQSISGLELGDDI